jgi:HMG (high mobility group) box
VYYLLTITLLPCTATGSKALSETALARLAGVKGPKNAFILFGADVRAELKASTSNNSTAAASTGGIGAVAQEIGARWKKISPADKVSHSLCKWRVTPVKYLCVAQLLLACMHAVVHVSVHMFRGTAVIQH